MTVLKLSEVLRSLNAEYLLHGDCEVVVEIENVRAPSRPAGVKALYDASDVKLRQHNTEPQRKVISFSNLTATAERNKRKRRQK